MWMRFNPLVRRLRDLVAAGAFGPVRSVTASFGFDLQHRPGHRLWDPALGGGALLDLGIYPLALAQLLLGEPESMTVTGALAPSGVDAEAGLMLTYPGGARAFADTSLVSPLATSASVAGTLMRADLDAPFFATGRMVLGGRPGAEPEEHLLEPGDTGYVGEIREVRDCLRAGLTESAVMPLDDSLAMMRLLDTARARLAG
jgi:predicted dehydrogenase